MGQGTGAARKRGGGVPLWLLVLMLFVGLAGAGGGRSVFGQAITGRVLSVGLGGVDGQGGLYRAGAWVPVQVRVENRSGKQFVGRLGVEKQVDLDGDRLLSLGPKFILQPTDVEGRILWAYYWPRPDDVLTGISSVLVFDEAGTPITSITTPDSRQSAVGIPPADDGRRSQRNVLLLGAKSMGWGGFFESWGGTEGVRFAWVRGASQLPDDAKGFDGVDVIVWQADAVKVSDLPPEFQLKALLDWVKSGGHLIISVGTQGQEFLKAGGALAGAMPIELTGSREISMHDLAASGVAGMTALTGNRVPLVQATGRLKPGARPVSGAFSGSFAEIPLAVTGQHGQGVVTVLTLDAGSPEFEQRLGDKDWILFWNRMAGWHSIDPKTSVEIEQGRAKGQEILSIPPYEIRLGSDLANSIDVTEVTQVRVLVTILFLGAYWLLAGPIGHLVLRYYKVVHWSWWIFGGTVLAATSLAGLVVLVLQVTTYDLRHRTFVLGTVGGPEASVVGFYGVYVPASGGIELQLPESSGGIHYLAPLCMPTQEEVKGFADPQSYTLHTDAPGTVMPVFRNTLKKMQARWSGPLKGLAGKAAFTADVDHPLEGELVNQTGYTLDEVALVTFRRHETQGGVAYLYTLPAWKSGEALDLKKAVVLDRWFGEGQSRYPVGEYLRYAGWKIAKSPYGGARGFAGLTGPSREEKAISEAIPASRAENLLFMLLDLRTPDGLTDTNGNIHHQPMRGVGRWLDRTKALKASGALIIARAGNMSEKQQRVPSPLELKVNGRKVEGQGEILFGWSLPVEGHAPSGAGSLLDKRDPIVPPAGGVQRGNGVESEEP